MRLFDDVQLLRTKLQQTRFLHSNDRTLCCYQYVALYFFVFSYSIFALRVQYWILSTWKKKQITTVIYSNHTLSSFYIWKSEEKREIFFSLDSQFRITEHILSIRPGRERSRDSKAFGFPAMTQESNSGLHKTLLSVLCFWRTDFRTLIVFQRLTF